MDILENGIATWSASSNNGAYQILTAYGIFSDLLIEKPIFSFNYTNFEYFHNGQTKVDEMPMTDEQKKEVQEFIIKRPIPQEFIDNMRKIPAIQYLSSTDWYIIRQADPLDGTPVPEDVLQRRKAAREFLSSFNTAAPTFEF